MRSGLAAAFALVMVLATGQAYGSVLAVGAEKLGYDDTGGSGKLVIAMPGLGDLRQEYRFLTPLLVRAGYRVATVDLRGFGETSASWSDDRARAVAADFLRIEDALGQRSAILVGDSYAAGAALWAAHEAPARVSALVLIGPALRDPPSRPSWTQRALLSIAFASPWRVSFWLDYWDSLFPTRRPPDQRAIRRALATNLRQPGRMRALRQMLALSKRDTEAIIGADRTPTLVVMGTKDPDFDDPVAEASWIARRSGATVQMVSGAGHYPQAEMPEVTGRAIIDFLAAPARIPLTRADHVSGQISGGAASAAPD